VWALGSFLLGSRVTGRGRHSEVFNVSVPVWALGSFLPAIPTVCRWSWLWFQCPCGLWGLFYSTGRSSPRLRPRVGLGWFQCPCGLWGLFYKLSGLGRTREAIEADILRAGFSARVGSGVFSTIIVAGTAGIVLKWIGFSARVGSGVFSTTSPGPSADGVGARFQCPCGLWGLFYRSTISCASGDCCRNLRRFQCPCGLWGLFYHCHSDSRR